MNGPIFRWNVNASLGVPYLGSNFKIHVFVSLTLSKVSIVPKTSSYKLLLQNFDF